MFAEVIGEKKRKLTILELNDFLFSFKNNKGNTFPSALLLVLLFVILFIIGTAVWIFFQCRRHYPERNNYGALESNMNKKKKNNNLKMICSFE